MKLSTRIKPVSYFKSHTSQVMRELEECREPMVITHNGKERAVIQDVTSWKQTQETMALLKILALGNRQIEEGKVSLATHVIFRISDKYERPRGNLKSC